jgi:hypothetical protein
MSEQNLIDTLIKNHVRFPWQTNELFYQTEVKVTANRVDVVYFEKKNNSEIGSIIAIEAKLHDWRRALQQAHRNKLFADRVYVALPARFSSAAITNIAEFRRVGIGLIVVDENESRIHFHPYRNNSKSPTHVSRVKMKLASVTY